MRRSLLLFVCVLLLLVAQQGALSHAMWHTQVHQTHNAHDQASGNGDQTPSGQASLCAFDLAFGQMLGIAHGSSVTPVAIATDVARIDDLPTSRVRVEVLSPKSRGPPASL